ncbi:hypothetical protein LCGC14_0750230 [marine sediment metagenome]|uniref:Uncharacterized protein n=1 Tax=marine sediment metagenome TaxID=412755 RepID=A0A0F9Q493_9ZZZZ
MMDAADYNKNVNSALTAVWNDLRAEAKSSALRFVGSVV